MPLVGLLVRGSQREGQTDNVTTFNNLAVMEADEESPVLKSFSRGSSLYFVLDLDSSSTRAREVTDVQ